MDLLPTPHWLRLALIILVVCQPLLVSGTPAAINPSWLIIEEKAPNVHDCLAHPPRCSSSEIHNAMEDSTNHVKAPFYQLRAILEPPQATLEELTFGKDDVERSKDDDDSLRLARRSGGEAFTLGPNYPDDGFQNPARSFSAPKARPAFIEASSRLNAQQRVMSETPSLASSASSATMAEAAGKRASWLARNPKLRNALGVGILGGTSLWAYAVTRHLGHLSVVPDGWRANFKEWVLTAPDKQRNPVVVDITKQELAKLQPRAFQEDEFDENYDDGNKLDRKRNLIKPAGWLALGAGAGAYGMNMYNERYPDYIEPALSSKSGHVPKHKRSFLAADASGQDSSKQWQQREPAPSYWGEAALGLGAVSAGYGVYHRYHKGKHTYDREHTAPTNTDRLVRRELALASIKDENITKPKYETKTVKDDLGGTTSITVVDGRPAHFVWKAPAGGIETSDSKFEHSECSLSPLSQVRSRALTQMLFFSLSKVVLDDESNEDRADISRNYTGPITPNTAKLLQDGVEHGGLKGTGSRPRASWPFIAVASLLTTWLLLADSFVFAKKSSAHAPSASEILQKRGSRAPIPNDSSASYHGEPARFAQYQGQNYESSTLHPAHWPLRQPYFASIPHDLPKPDAEVEAAFARVADRLNAQHKAHNPHQGAKAGDRHLLMHFLEGKSAAASPAEMPTPERTGSVAPSPLHTGRKGTSAAVPLPSKGIQKSDIEPFKLSEAQSDSFPPPKPSSALESIVKQSGHSKNRIMASLNNRKLVSVHQSQGSAGKDSSFPSTEPPLRNAYSPSKEGFGTAGVDRANRSLPPDPPGTNGPSSAHRIPATASPPPTRKLAAKGKKFERQQLVKLEPPPGVPVSPALNVPIDGTNRARRTPTITPPPPEMGVHPPGRKLTAKEKKLGRQQIGNLDPPPSWRIPPAQYVAGAHTGLQNLEHLPEKAALDGFEPAPPQEPPLYPHGDPSFRDSSKKGTEVARDERSRDVSAATQGDNSEGGQPFQPPFHPSMLDSSSAALQSRFKYLKDERQGNDDPGSHPSPSGRRIPLPPERPNESSPSTSARKESIDEINSEDRQSHGHSAPKMPASPDAVTFSPHDSFLSGSVPGEGRNRKPPPDVPKPPLVGRRLYTTNGGNGIYDPVPNGRTPPPSELSGTASSTGWTSRPLLYKSPPPSEKRQSLRRRQMPIEASHGSAVLKEFSVQPHFKARGRASMIAGSALGLGMTGLMVANMASSIDLPSNHREPVKSNSEPGSDRARVAKRSFEDWSAHHPEVATSKADYRKTFSGLVERLFMWEYLPAAVLLSALVIFSVMAVRQITAYMAASRHYELLLDEADKPRTPGIGPHTRAVLLMTPTLVTLGALAFGAVMAMQKPQQRCSFARCTAKGDVNELDDIFANDPAPFASQIALQPRLSPPTGVAETIVVGTATGLAAGAGGLLTHALLMDTEGIAAPQSHKFKSYTDLSSTSKSAGSDVAAARDSKSSSLDKRGGAVSPWLVGGLGAIGGAGATAALLDWDAKRKATGYGEGVITEPFRKRSADNPSSL